MMSVPGTLGCTIDAPADAAYAVLPVGVDIITPNAVIHRCILKSLNKA